jgi:hypothetical protein
VNNTIETAVIFYSTHPYPKNPDTPPVSNVKAGESGFGGFVTMPLGIFGELFGTKPEIAHYQFRIQPEHHPGAILEIVYIATRGYGV